MATTKCPVTKGVIAALGTTPQERGLETPVFKAKFDQEPDGIIDYINNTLTVEVDTHLADNALHFFRDGGFLSGEVDFDLLTANRIYQLLTPTGTNAPTGVGYGILLYWTSGAYGLQMCVDVTSNKLLVRTNSGTWNTWVEK